MKPESTLKSFLADEHMTWLRDHIKEARGVLVVPQMLKGAFFIGGSGGSGVLVVRDEKTNEWSQPAFFTLGGASFGFQFGGQASEVVILVMSQKGVDSLMSTTIKLGAGRIDCCWSLLELESKALLPQTSAPIYSRSREQRGSLRVFLWKARLLPLEMLGIPPTTTNLRRQLIFLFDGMWKIVIHLNS